MTMKTIAFFLLIVLCGTGCSKNSNELPTIIPPVADFTYQGSGVANAPIVFRNESSNAIIYNWDFGDSTTSQEKNPVHIYKEEGTYSVILLTYGDTTANVINDVIVKDIKIEALGE
jgi:PKD repeat protein